MWRWSRFQRNKTSKNIITPPRQAKRRHWARRHWLALAAFAWERFLKDGPGWVLAKRLRRRSTSPWFLDGYQVDYAMGSPDYDPHRSICLRFHSKEPEETRSPWDEWCLTMEPSPPVAYRLQNGNAKEEGCHNHAAIRWFSLLGGGRHAGRVGRFSRCDGIHLNRRCLPAKSTSAVLPAPLRQIEPRQQSLDLLSVTDGVQSVFTTQRSSQSPPAQVYRLVLAWLSLPAFGRRLGPATQTTARSMRPWVRCSNKLRV